MTTTTPGDVCTTCGKPAQNDWDRNTRRDGTGWDCSDCRLLAHAQAEGLPTGSDLPAGAYLANLGGWVIGVRYDVDDDTYRLLTASDDDDQNWDVGQYCDADDDGHVHTFASLPDALTALTA